MASYDSSYYSFMNDNDYFDDSSYFDPDSFIRKCNDAISDAYGRIDSIQRDKASAESSNRLLAIQKCIVYGLYALIFIFWGGLFLNGHWFIGLFIYPYIAGAIGSVLEAWERTFRYKHKEDISRYDGEITQENLLVARLQREIKIAQEELKRRKNSNSYRQSTGHGKQSHQSQERYNNFNSKEIALKEQYDILGCSPNISDAALKQLYRELMKEYHPDHVQSVGNGPHLIKLAEEQAKKINSAYDEILKSRGIR